MIALRPVPPHPEPGVWAVLDRPSPLEEQTSVSVLDNPVWWALAGPQRHLGTSTDRVVRFHPEISPFAAVPAAATDDDWLDLARMAGSGGQLALVEEGEGALRPGPGWSVEWELAGVQMVWEKSARARGVLPGPGPNGLRASALQLESLGPDDVGEMLALVAVTRPGPFLARTVEFGGYLGVRSGGRLIAMAGERMRPPGFAEVSAVATDPDHRRHGLGEFLVRSVAAGIVERGETPFLHAASSNVNAIRLYESIGFTVRRTVAFLLAKAPIVDPATS